MPCEYTFNGETYGSYQALIEALSNENFDSIADILFSKGDKQAIICDAIQSARKEAFLSTSNTQLIDGGPDIEHDSDTFTTQTFIDSAYFKVGGESPIFQLSTEDYVRQMKEKFVADKVKTKEGAEEWGETVQERWDTIAHNALDFHKLMLGEHTTSAYEWSTKTANTAFSGITNQVMKAQEEIFKRVMMRNGRDQRDGESRGVLYKNVNLQAEIRNLSESILGHIDYLVVRDNGDIEIFNIKTSTEPYEQWSSVKKEKYKYQMALVKRILGFHGIPTNHIRLNIIPVQLKYNENFDEVTDIQVHNAEAIDAYNLKYNFQHYDMVAAQFIDSTADFSKVNSEALLKVSTQLQHIFPGANIAAEGITQTAQDWIRSNWSYCQPEAQPNGGWKLTIPDTKEVITLTDSRRAEKNEEFVKIIEDKLNNSTVPFAGEISAYMLRTDIENCFRNGVLSSRMTGKSWNYIQQQFGKYINDKTKKDGKLVYKWQLVESPALDAANIIAFQNTETNQLDVFTISSFNPSVKYSFKGRKNLLGYHIPDMNTENFEMECNYGNIDAIRTVAILNEILPEIGGTYKLGQLKVIGIDETKSRQGAFFEFDSLLAQWGTILKVVNKSQNTSLVNNFKLFNIECIAPEEVLRQAWLEASEDATESEIAAIQSLSDVIDRKVDIDGTIYEGLMGMQTIEGKIEKLEVLISRLRELCDKYGVNYRDPEALYQTSIANNAHTTPFAKLYILASQALSKYYGDISMNNEAFSTLQEYGMKTTSMGNSFVRRTGYLTQKSIDNIRHDILEEYLPNAMPIFKQFYEDSNYTPTRNATIGDQARMYNNLFVLDDQGRNTFVFKNPYDMSVDLKPHEREFLKKILYEFYKVRCRMHKIPVTIKGVEDQKLLTDMPTNYLYVPLQKASSATQRLNVKEGLKSFGKMVHRMITKPKEVFEEVAGHLSQEEVDLRDKSIRDMSVYNPYQAFDSKMDMRVRQIAEKGEGYFETNVENIFIDFLSKQVQCDEFNKLLVRINGIETAITLKGYAEDDTESIKHTIKAIDDFVTLNVYNKSIMEATSQKIDVWLRPLRRLVSQFYIAASPVAAMRDTLQGLQENFLQAAIKYQTDINIKDVAFGYTQVLGEGCTNMMNMSKLNQFNIKYGFSNFDAAKVAERLKTGRGGVLNADNWAYWTLRAPDYLNRMTLFVAKLHHDGAWDAYSLDDDHRLKYNWRLDKRFSVYASGDTANPEYNKQKAFYYSMIRAFNVQNPNLQLSYTDDLPDAYTPEQIRAIKTLGESIYGAYDKSSQAKYEQIAIGRNFMFFSTWMNGIVDNYWKSRQVSQSELRLEQETDYNGNPLFFTSDESGNVTTVDTGLPVTKHVPIMVQGILQTFGESFRELHNSGWNFKEFLKGDVWNNEVNRRNYRRAMTDLAMMALLSLLFKMWLTPAYKQHKAEADGKEVFTNVAVEMLYKSSISSFDTFGGPYAVLTYLGEQTNPATYTLQSKILGDAYKFIVGDRTFQQTAMGSVALLRNMQDSYRMYMRDTQPK